MKRRLLLPQLTLLMSAALVLGLLCTPSHAVILPVVSQDFEAEANGAFGVVSNFSGFAANPSAQVVAAGGNPGKALLFQFTIPAPTIDPNTGNPVSPGVLNVNVASPFPTLATNNELPDLSRYTLEFDVRQIAGPNTGWFGPMEVYTPPNAFRLQNYTPLVTNGPYVHHSFNLAGMSLGFGGEIDVQNDNWNFRMVALGFPVGGPGGTVRLLLDNVRVTVDVPEPASLALGLASGALCLVRRRRS